jgi:hypothetical protein
MLTFWCLFKSDLRAKLLSHLLHWWLFSRLESWVCMWGFRLFVCRISFPQISHLCPCFPARRGTPITLQNVFKDTMANWDVAISELKVMGYRSGFGPSIDFFYERSFKTKAFEVLGIKRSANHVFYIHAGVKQYKNESLFLSSVLLFSCPCHRGCNPLSPSVLYPGGHGSVWRNSRLVGSYQKSFPVRTRHSALIYQRASASRHHLTLHPTPDTVSRVCLCERWMWVNSKTDPPKRSV